MDPSSWQHRHPSASDAAAALCAALSRAGMLLGTAALELGTGDTHDARLGALRELHDIGLLEYRIDLGVAYPALSSRSRGYLTDHPEEVTALANCVAGLQGVDADQVMQGLVARFAASSSSQER